MKTLYGDVKPYLTTRYEPQDSFAVPLDMRPSAGDTLGDPSRLSAPPGAEVTLTERRLDESAPTEQAEVPAERPLDLKELIRTLPGYDPHAQAGDCEFDEEAAQRRIGFIEKHCTFTQGRWAGQPFRLMPWQKAVVANLYGWKRPDGTRRYRIVLVLIPRGGGKSEFAAALVCVALFMRDEPEEPGGHVYSAAGKRNQTKYVFDPVCAMIRANPQMNARAEIFKPSVVVGDRPYWPMSRETHTGTEHGGAPAFAVADELHAHLDRRLINAIETGMIKRLQPILVCISTSDFEREGSPCNQMEDYARGVINGTKPDPSFLPAVFAASKEDDWTDPATWRKANPSMGVTIQERDIAALCEKAKLDPAFENEFKRLCLDIRTEQSTRVLPIERWDACRGVLPQLNNKECWCGLDLGATSDLTAFAAVFHLDEGCVGALFRFWVPEDAVRARQQRGDPSYATWVRQGFMKQTPGAEVDYDQVRADINDFAKAHSIQELAADRLFQGAQLVQQLREQDGFEAFPHGQGFVGMAAPMKAFLEMVNKREVVHDGNPVMRWMVSNLAAVQDAAGNWKPDKSKSADKIDGVVALVMALGRAVLGGLGPKRDYYEDHPVRSL